MAELHLERSPMWLHTQPWVGTIYKLIQQNAILHQGNAFSFDFPFHFDRCYCVYRSGLFSSGWTYHSDSSISAEEAVAKFKAACATLRTYIAGCRLKTIVVEDTRPTAPKDGDTGYTKTDYQMTISVNSTISWAVYLYYNSFGKEFKERVQSAHSTFINKIATAAVSFFLNRISPQDRKEKIFSIDIGNNTITYDNQWQTYESLGFVPLTAMYQCYGLLAAILEEIASVTKDMADISATVSFETPYVVDTVFGCIGHVTLQRQIKLNEW